MSEELELWISLASLGFSKYEISTLGRICNVVRNYNLKGSVNTNGYLCVGIYDDDGKQSTIGIHILVAKMFISNPENKPTVDPFVMASHNKVTEINLTTKQLICSGLHRQNKQ